MEKSNSKHNNLARRLLVVGGIGMLTLGGCSGPNYNGKGNDFVVDGKVVKVGHQSLTADIYQVKTDKRAAESWFTDGKRHQIHDNVTRPGGWIYKEVTYGKVVDEAGHVITLRQIHEGERVEFTGKIHANHEGKLDISRPVYDMAQITECPSDI